MCRPSEVVVATMATPAIGMENRMVMRYPQQKEGPGFLYEKIIEKIVS